MIVIPSRIEIFQTKPFHVSGEQEGEDWLGHLFPKVTPPHLISCGRRGFGMISKCPQGGSSCWQRGERGGSHLIRDGMSRQEFEMN